MDSDELDTIMEKVDLELKWICIKCGLSYCFGGENNEARERFCPHILKLALMIAIKEDN